MKINRADIQRENILKNAYILFKEKGYNKTTTREIANKSNINRGLLHYYYKQKEDIISDMYNDFLNGLTNYFEKECTLKINGFTYFAVLNTIFYRTISSRTYLINNLSEIMLNRTLTKIKIEKSSETCYKILKDYDIPITEYQMFLAITVAIGAESELLLSMLDGKNKMTFDKLATTINKLLFTMLKINEAEISTIILESNKIANEININSIFEYIKKNYSWVQD